MGADLRSEVDAELARMSGQDFDPEPIPGQTALDGADVPPEASSAPAEGLCVTGTAQLSMFDLGGKQPLSGVLAVKGVKVPLTGGTAFKKGQTVVLELVAVVEEVGQKDKVDKATGIVIECEQKHSARVTDVRLVESS